MGVHAAAPQMHPALLAVVPSVSEQSGPVAQRQVLAEEHLCVEVVLVLKRRSMLLSFQHPGGRTVYESTYALVSLIPKLTAAASQAAFVPSSCLPVTDPQNSLSTYEWVTPLPQVEHALLQ